MAPLDARRAGLRSRGPGPASAPGPPRAGASARARACVQTAGAGQPGSALPSPPTRHPGAPWAQVAGLGRQLEFLGAGLPPGRAPGHLQARGQRGRERRGARWARAPGEARKPSLTGSAAAPAQSAGCRPGSGSGRHCGRREAPAQEQRRAVPTALGSAIARGQPWLLQRRRRGWSRAATARAPAHPARALPAAGERQGSGWTSSRASWTPLGAAAAAVQVAHCGAVCCPCRPSPGFGALFDMLWLELEIRPWRKIYLHNHRALESPTRLVCRARVMAPGGSSRLPVPALGPGRHPVGLDRPP
jgi:hypothetical protein